MDERKTADEVSSTALYDRMIQGDEAAVEQLWRLMAPRMLAVAQRHLNEKIRSQLDAMDAVQSAFKSFWRKAHESGFEGEMHSENLWRLLRRFLLNKLSKKHRAFRTQRRGGRLAVHPLPSDETAASASKWGIVRPLQHARLEMDELMMRLDLECRTIAAMRLARFSNREISAILGGTERRIERKLEKIREQWRKYMGPDGL
jgi:RNA polymerase sigma factor (sigma-70 family)